MKITVMTMQRDEERMLPYFLRHYTPHVDEIVLFDNGSTDRTVDIALSTPGVRVVPFDTGGKHDTPKRQEIRCGAYKNMDADWFIVVDTDEFLWHPDGLRTYLERCNRASCTICHVQGWNMIADSLPPDDGKTPLIDLLKSGGRIDRQCGTRHVPVGEYFLYDKHAAFHRDVDIRYAPGAHFCDPRGRVVWMPRKELKLLHYKWVDYDYCMRRMQDRGRRLSPANLANGWSYRIDQLEGEAERSWREWYAWAMTSRVQVIP